MLIQLENGYYTHTYISIIWHCAMALEHDDGLITEDNTHMDVLSSLHRLLIIHRINNWKKEKKEKQKLQN